MAAAQDALPSQWQGVGIGQLLWEQFDDEYFVFNPASGHTHLLNALGAATLQLLATETLDENQLLSRLAALYDGEQPPELPRALAEHLQQLDTIGLIRKVAS